MIGNGLLNFALVLTLLGVQPIFAQEEGTSASASEEEVLKAASKPTTKSYLNLSVGVYSDEKLEDLPKDIEIDGTFRKQTRVQWNPDTKTLRFNPHTAGVGTLIIKHPKTGSVLMEYTVDVRKTDLQKVAREMQALLQGIEGIQIKVLNNRVIVDGQILLPSDMKRIHSVVKQYLPQATSLVILSPIAQNKIAQFIEKKIGNPEIKSGIID